LGKGNATCGHRRNAIIRCLFDSAHNDSYECLGALGTVRSLRIDGHMVVDASLFFQ
jgi:hypothetical protein